MNKFIKINKFLFLLLFIYSCGVGEALQGKKRSDQGDEFLIDKKSSAVNGHNLIVDGGWTVW